jgi:formylglycine-generating enzyme required for sulfatase activity
MAAPEPTETKQPTSAVELIVDIEVVLANLRSKSPELLNALTQYRVELAQKTADLRSSLSRTGRTLEQLRKMTDAESQKIEVAVQQRRLDRRCSDLWTYIAKLDNVRARNNALIKELQYVLTDLTTKQRSESIIDQSLQSRARELVEQASDFSDLSPLKILERPEDFLARADADKKTAAALAHSPLPSRPEKQPSDLPPLPMLDVKAAGGAEEFLLEDLRDEFEKGQAAAEGHFKDSRPEAAIESLQAALQKARERVEAFAKGKPLSWQSQVLEQLANARKALSEQLAEPYLAGVAKSIPEARKTGDWNAVLDLLEAVARLAPAAEKLDETLKTVEDVLQYRINTQDLDAVVAFERFKVIKGMVSGIPYQPFIFTSDAASPNAPSLPGAIGEFKQDGIDLAARLTAQNNLGMVCRAYVAQQDELIQLLQRFTAKAVNVQRQEAAIAKTLGDMERLLALRDLEDKRVFLAYGAQIAGRESARQHLLDSVGLRADAAEVKQVDQQIETLKRGQSDYREGYDRAEGKGAKVDPKKLVDDARNFVVVQLNSVGMLMVPISKGSFMMGIPESDRESDEAQVPVTITKDFQIGAFEVTNAQYLRFLIDASVKFDDGWIELVNGPITRSGSGFALRDSGAGNQPVTHVSWHGAVAFCAWLSKKEGRTYRLPTEAEWEYAARAGTTSAYPWGDQFDESRANVGSRFVKNVGSYAPNRWGLFDVVGNASEWTADRYAEKLSGGVDPVGPSKGSYRCDRGGYYLDAPGEARCGSRVGGGPSSLGAGQGFRVAASPMGPAVKAK